MDWCGYSLVSNPFADFFKIVCTNKVNERKNKNGDPNSKYLLLYDFSFPATGSTSE